MPLLQEVQECFETALITHFFYSFRNFIIQTHCSIVIDFSKADRDEYDILEATARDFYQGIKCKNGGSLGRHFLLLTQKLMPLQTACAGGRMPLDTDEEEKEDTEDGSRKKKERKFSGFAFTSKLKTLVVELERTRTIDPTGTRIII